MTDDAVPGSSALQPCFFATPAAFRAWLDAYHASAGELWVGYYKKGSGQPSITWPESVDEALCFGWIDGVRKTIDAERYTIRFTPRRPRSIWSTVNIGRVTELTRQGRMHPAGLAAFAARQAARSGVYTYEQAEAARLAAADEQTFRANEAAWTFFEAQAPGYRRTAIRWVVNAKQEATRQRRLAALIADSARGRRLGALSRPSSAE
jgi:uncharacterized protein YdeI (YjbR/CyaY-like superfamily)